MFEDVLAVFHLLRPYVGASLCVLGGLLVIIGTVGVLRFPDFYTRLHASSVTDTSAMYALILGMALMAPSWLVVAKLGAIWVFLFLTSPTATHAIANAAHVAGLEPLIGREAARGRAKPEDIDMEAHGG